MNLRGYRDAVAAALDDLDDNWTVLPGPVDALDPPAFLLVWGPDPYREPLTVCTDTASLQVVVVSGRFVPDAADLCDDMVDAAYAALTAAGFRPVSGLAPAAFDIGNRTYLAARIQLSRPVTIGEEL